MPDWSLSLDLQNGFASAGMPIQEICSHRRLINVAIAVNRAADPAMTDVFERGAPYTQHYWSGDRAETWYLDLLAVDQNQQRKGFGRELVMWGVSKADEERVCASVIASDVGEDFYVSCGFAPVGWAGEGEGNPLRTLPGGCIMFRDAKQRLI
ncbi:hypothetical protein MBLNU459_g5152t2 [Dothideomycetes sp. NU459]